MSRFGNPSFIERKQCQEMLAEFHAAMADAGLVLSWDYDTEELVLTQESKTEPGTLVSVGINIGNDENLDFDGSVNVDDDENEDD